MTTETQTPIVAAGPRWQRRKQARPQELLDAALVEFVERGFSGARLEDIARRAGCTKGTIFLYFEGKEDLFKSVVRQTMVPLLESAESLADQHHGSAESLLAALLRHRWRGMMSTVASALPKLMFAEAGHFPDLARFYHDEVITRSRAPIERAIRLGIANGEFREVDVEDVARLALAPMLLAATWRHAFSRHLGGSDSLDRESYLETSLEVLLRGLRRNVTSETPGHA
jgi:AcrR family transcriptional regulator